MQKSHGVKTSPQVSFSGALIIIIITTITFRLIYHQPHIPILTRLPRGDYFSAQSTNDFPLFIAKRAGRSLPVRIFMAGNAAHYVYAEHKAQWLPRVVYGPYASAEDSQSIEECTEVERASSADSRGAEREEAVWRRCHCDRCVSDLLWCRHWQAAEFPKRARKSSNQYMTTASRHASKILRTLNSSASSPYSTPLETAQDNWKAAALPRFEHRILTPRESSKMNCHILFQ